MRVSRDDERYWDAGIYSYVIVPYDPETDLATTRVHLGSLEGALGQDALEAMPERYWEIHREVEGWI